ncbi:unnamed protein product [Rhizoctonia solani]|uniref:Uncharacterized protein n=1 Tax=Rhizoctonia solani TaxID=456999 RepID=A0A8H3A210_9AGAM|nr:unnamed protein product [Rhizoctonia solani]
MPLLFDEIYLHTPAQLFKLCINADAMSMLNRTKSIYLGERLFSSDSWPSQFFEAVPSLIVHLLSVMKSLTRLQIYSTDKILETGYDFRTGFQRKLDSAASDPTFLPNLAIIIELPDHISLQALCQNRPIFFFYHHEDPYMHADIYPGFEKSGVDVTYNLSAHDVGTLVQESQYTSPNVYCGAGIAIKMRFPREIKCGSQAPVRDSLAWTRTMLAASRIPSDQLYSLEISFEPNPPFQAVEVQLVELEELYEEFPGLEDVTISYPEFHWSRSVDHSGYESKFFEEDTLPEWTPSPLPYALPHCINWWLKELRLSSPETQSDEEFAETIAKLADGIFLRWCPHTLCSLERLTESLFEYYNRPLGSAH